MRWVRGAVPLVVALAISGPLAASAGADRPPGAPTALTVDDDAAPLAVTGPPSFGWHVVDADRDEVQTAYELVVATAAVRDPRDTSVLFDSGRVRSARQSYVPAPSLRLEPDRTYWWTVRTWDRAQRASPFANPARFDTGLADADWHASWIRRPVEASEVLESFTLVRKELVLSHERIARARAYMSAGQQYDLRVNGTRVAHGPSFSYADEQYYEATDITPQLHEGTENAIGVVTHWTAEGQGRPRSAPGLIARITVDYADGTRDVVTTDGTWRVHVGPWTQGRLRNDEGDFVEHLDGRNDPVGWDEPGFDDSAWAPAEIIGPHPSPPFLHLFAARTHIVEHDLSPQSVQQLRSGAYVADYGRVVAATPVVRLHAGASGRQVTVAGGFLLDPDGSVSRTHGTQGTDMRWEYVERDGEQTFRPFGYLAFRYLEVDGAGEPLGARDLVVSARHASMPDEDAATFHTSDPRIDAVWSLARHSALYDSQEQFLDTPTREKGQFLVDAFDVSSATMRAFGERALTEQALRDFARSQTRYWPDGRVNAVYPNGDEARDIPDYTETYPEWVWRTYVDTGNREILESFYPTVRAISAYVARSIDAATGLVTNLPGGGGDYEGGIVDWPPAMRYGYDVGTAARTTQNLLAVATFERAAQMAEALGRPPAEASAPRDRARRLTDAIRTHLMRRDGVLVDGLEADGSPSPHASQHANAYALAYGVVPSAQQHAVAAYVVSLGTAMGPMTADVLLRALHAAGRDDAIVAALTDPNRPGWAQILARGATFTWESWNARDVAGDSESHGWGASVLAVLQADVLGVTIAEPGAARVEVRLPDVRSLRARGVVPTQRGEIAVGWQRAPGRFSLDLTIPPNVTATVHLPGAARARTIGSGHYHFDTGHFGTGASTRGASFRWWLVIAGAGVLLLGVVARSWRRR